MTKINNEEIIKALGNMNALELKALADAIQVAFDIKEMAVASGSSSGDQADKKPAATEFDIDITVVGNKLQGIQCLRGKDWAKSEMGPAKAFLEADPRPLLSVFLKVQRSGKKFSEDEANAIAKDLKEAGMEVKIIAS